MVIRPVHKSAPITALKQRQREVEQRLAMFGLRRGPYGLTQKPSAFEESDIRRLRLALEGLGPVFCSFGLYLSTRIDLFDANDCLELAQLSEGAQESPPAVVSHLITRELGHPPENAYLAFEEKPFVADLLHQQHHAWLISGEAVIVKVLHQQAEELIESDVQLLQLLKGSFLVKGLSDSDLKGAIDDFVLTLQQQTDFSHQAGALATLTNDTEVFGLLRVPLVYTHLSTSRVLTTERLPGDRLEELLRSIPAEGERPTIISDEQRYLLARRLCVVWLRQALLGSLFPANPSPAGIIIPSDNRIAFSDGVFAGLTSEVKTNLWDYLIAVATESPDRACAHLVRELERGKHSVSDEELQQAFRQGVPFRDTDWAYSGRKCNLADHLALHWRLASEGGRNPRPHLLRFYRSLLIIAGTAQRLAPTRDALQDALQDVRILAGVERFREMLTVREVGEQIERYFGMMIDLPQRLDEALTLMANGNASERLQVPAVSEPAYRKSGRTAVATVLLMMAAMVVLSPHLDKYFSDGWVQGIKALGLLLGAITLLRAAGRW